MIQVIIPTARIQALSILLVAVRVGPMVKITKLPPGEARGARDLQRWGRFRRYGSHGQAVGTKTWVCRNGHETKALRTVRLERCPKCNVIYERKPAKAVLPRPASPVHRDTQSVTYRKVLGDWGEAHACRLLKAAKFADIVPLNVGRQHPGGDVMATKSGRTYFFSVKARDRFGQDGKPNPGYNIYPEKVINAAQTYDAAPAWLVIRADRRSNTFSAYWGLIAEIPASKARRNRVYVKMGEDDIAQYCRLGRCLASDVSDPMIAKVFHGKVY